jgi:integrase
VGAHQGSRIDAIWAYIEWRAGNIISKLSKKDAEVNICNNKLKALNKQIKKVRGSSKSIERGMLTIDQYHRLIQIVKPGSPENPFQKQNQLRNYLIFLAYGEFGIRRAEILTMKGRHLSIGPNSTVLVTFTPNDPHDPRIKTPSVKTKSRILPMSNHMAGCFVDLLKQRRTNSRIANAAKKTEFIMLSSHTGKPLSIDAVDHIFVVIRERFPDEFPDNFGPHHLRRTWNYRFSAMCKEKGIKKEEENKLRKYGMGWSENSKQPEKYNRAAIEEQTAELLIAMQNRMTG